MNELSKYFTPVGCDTDNARYVLITRNGENLILKFSPEELGRKATWLQLAPLHVWKGIEAVISQTETADGKVRRSLSADQMLDFLIDMTSMEKAGLYNPERIRGRGIWRDEERYVGHFGSGLYVVEEDGSTTKTPLHAFESKFAYVRSEESITNLDKVLPMTTEEASKLLDIMDLFPWQDRLHGAMLLGWIAIAPLCGMMSWRPHLWITGPAGAGKSTCYTLARAILKQFSIGAIGNTTEAGLRQALKNEALPILFDEAEKKGGRDIHTGKILELARIASSDVDGSMLKGSAGGVSKGYACKTTFMFMSINDSVAEEQDKQRTAIVSLDPNVDEHLTMPEKTDRYDRVKLLLNRITPAFSERFLLRMTRLAPIVEQNIVSFRDALLEEFEHVRYGLMFGTFLAGMYSFYSEEVVDKEEAKEFMKLMEFKWDYFKDEVTQTESAGKSLVRTILQYPIRIDGEEFTVQELICENILNGYVSFDSEKAKEINRQLGVYGLKATKTGLFIASKNENLSKRILVNTVGSTNHNDILKTLKGAERRVLERIGGVHTRGLILPYDLVNGNNEDTEEEIEF